MPRMGAGDDARGACKSRFQRGRLAEVGHPRYAPPMPDAAHFPRLRTTGTNGTPSAASVRHRAVPDRPLAPMTWTFTVLLSWCKSLW